MGTFLVLGAVIVGAILIGLLPTAVQRFSPARLEPGSLAEWKSLSPKERERRTHALEVSCGISGEAPSEPVAPTIIDYTGGHACNDCEFAQTLDDYGNIRHHLVSRCADHTFVNMETF